MIRAFLYLFVMVGANISSAHFAPFELGPFIVDAGTMIIGFIFILRDLVQNKFGRKVTYMFIGGALIISAISSFILGDPMAIVIGSALSFAVSETLDTEIYSRMKQKFLTRVVVSGIVGGTLDSIVFVVIALSPIGMNFVPWEAVPAAILAQVVIKVVMQIAGAGVLKGIMVKKKVEII